MKKSTINKNIYYVLGIVLVLGIWCLVSFFFDESNMIFPSIFKVVSRTIEILGTSYIYECLTNTFLRMTIGFVTSFLLALIVGSIAGEFEAFEYMVKPLITVLKTIPTASLVFLFLILSGASNAPIYIVVLVCFPILYEAVLSGYQNIEIQLQQALALEDTNKIVKLLRVKLPLATPYIIVGIASSLGLSFKIEIMAEILTGSTKNGLGSAISYIQKADPTDMTGIFAYTLIAIGISLIFSYLLNLTREKITKN